MLYLTGHAGVESAASLSPDRTDSGQHTAQSEVRPWVMGVILSIAACLIVSTNLVVAVALLKLLLKKSSQSWCFVLNLALADALVGVAITGLAAEDFNSNDNNVPQNQVTAELPTNTTPPAQGKARCLMRMVFVTSPCTASIMSMFLISLDRYAAIKMPLRYSLLAGKGTAIGSLLTLWTGAITVGFLPVMVRQLQAERYNGFCTFFSVIHEVGIIVLFSLCFFPVLSVFVYIYLDILKIACTHQKQICKVREAGSRTADDRGHRPHQQQHQHQHQHQHQQHQHQQQHQQQQQLRSGYRSHVKALRTVALLVGCFLVLWCPFFVVCIVHVLCKSCKLASVLENYLWLLGLSNSLINPLVYAFWQREVRLQLAAMFSCFRGRSTAAGTPSTANRYHPQLPQPGVSGRDAVNPKVLQTVTCNSENQTVAISGASG